LAFVSRLYNSDRFYLGTGTFR